MKCDCWTTTRSLVSFENLEHVITCSLPCSYTLLWFYYSPVWSLCWHRSYRAHRSGIPTSREHKVGPLCVCAQTSKSEKDRKIKLCNSASQKTQKETQNSFYWELRLIGSLKRGAFALKLDMKFCCKIKAVDSDCEAKTKLLVWKQYIILSFVII